MSDIPPFTGFPKEGFRFLKELKENNRREWFQERKQNYEDYILQPALSLIYELGERLKLISPGLTYDLAKNGSGSLMRIYRDTRFSKDKTPYKTHVGMFFWEGKAKKTENPGFWFGFDAGSGGMHVGQHTFPKPTLIAYREAVAAGKLGSALQAALDEVRAAGEYEVGGEHYKRVPRGYDPEHPRADLLRYNSLFASSPPIPKKVLTSADLVDECFDHAVRLAPVHKWLVKLARRVES